jgi:hypothetical protein
MMLVVIYGYGIYERLRELGKIDVHMLSSIDLPTHSTYEELFALPSPQNRPPKPYLGNLGYARGSGEGLTGE